MSEQDPQNPGSEDPNAGGDPAAGEDPKGNEDPNAGDDPAGGEDPQPYVPEGLPEHYQGENDQETIDKLHKAVDGFRKDQADKKGVPEKIDDYSIELPEDLAEKVLVKGEDGTDPVFEKMREKFFEQGIPAEAALNLIQDFYGDVAEMAENMAEEQKDNEIDSDYTEFGGVEKAQPTRDAVTAWITGLQTQGVIDEADAKEMSLHIEYGQGLRWLDKIRVTTGGKAIPADLDGKNTKSGKTKEDLDKMMEDPKYWRDKDPAFIDQVTKGFQELYGDEEAA